ncbi:MAG: hypothetical protein JW969_10275 [Spirochaetales bacterium]|nr:hypothetical protein [Spirochaetales bacterium]
MKKLNIMIIVFLCVITIPGLQAQDRGLGVGVLLGEPTGLSVKYWLFDPLAIDLGAAWSFIDQPSFHIHADLLFHFMNLIPVPAGKLSLYFGGGARIKIQDYPNVGIRIPVGLTYFIPKVPMDVFLEAAPIVELYPATRFTINAGIGVRYFFAF